MLGKLGQLRDLLGARQKQPDPDISRLIASRPRTVEPFGSQPQPPRSSEAEQIADNIETHARTLSEDGNKINALLDEFPLLRSELSPTVAELQGAINKFTTSIVRMTQIMRQAAKTIPSDTSIGPFIIQQSNDLSDGELVYEQWMIFSIQRIETKTQEIRNWR